MSEPLSFTVEIETSTGRTFSLDGYHPVVTKRPVIHPWATLAGDGFGPSTFEVARDPDLDYPDLQRGAKITYRAQDGTVAYEGRIDKAVQSGQTATVETVGWAGGYLRNRPFTEIYVDRDPASWGSSSLALRLAQVGADRVLDVHYTAEATGDSLRFSGTEDENIPTGSRAILEYVAPSANLIGEVQYRGAERNIAGAQEEDPTLYAEDDDGQTFGSWDSYALTLDDTLRSRTVTTPRRFLALILNAVANHTPANPAHRTYTKIACYGVHGVPLQDNGSQPDGVTASDVIEDILARFAPKVALDTPGTTYPIGHLAFHEPITPYDAIVRCNEFHHWNLGVYEGPTLQFGPVDLSRADWIIRRDWPGVEVNLPRDTAGDYTGVPVSYEDIETGRTEVLWPDENEELQDTSETIPANAFGEDNWAEAFSVPFPCTSEDALQMGAEHLLDLNTPKAPGTITVKGRLKDSYGNWQPAWLPRAGQSVAVTSYHNPGVHLITSTSFDPQTQTLEIGTDYEPNVLDVFLLRRETAAVGRLR